MSYKLRAPLGAIFLCLGTQVHAVPTTYYVSNGSWSDSNNGTSSVTPWKTLDKVNAATLNPGDTVKFKAGDVWEGTLQPKNGVLYTSYGGGGSTPAPVIRASTNVGNLAWTRYQGNIFVADVSSVVRGETDAMGVVFPAAITQLIYNGQRLQRARYPNIGGGDFDKGRDRYKRLSANATVETLNNVRSQKITLAPGITLDGDAGGQVLVKNYTWYLTRYNVQGASSNVAKLVDDKTWPGTLEYPIVAGNGYWLENNLWMLDQDGEWVFNPTTGKLYVQLPNGVTPAGTNLYASVRAHAVQANNVANVALQGLILGESRGDAVTINGATGSVNLSALQVLRAGSTGIAVTNNGTGTGSIDSSLVSDSVNGGIYLGANSTRNIHVNNNTVNNAGVGYYADAAIWLGHGSNAANNVVNGASYIGLRVAKSNTISGNVIKGTCMEFDDCGGIYTRGQDYDGSGYGLAYPNDVSSTISGNLLDGAVTNNWQDRLDGVAGANQSSVRGIYLDDYSGAVTVDGNYVTNFDLGVMLHLARKNVVKNNTLFNNVQHQLWMQENASGALPCGSQPNCDAQNYLVGNTVSGNVMASGLKNPTLRQNSDYANTSDFGTYSNNLYASYVTRVFAQDSPANATTQDKSFVAWQNGGKDTTSSLFSTSEGWQPLGANLVTNGGFNSVNGWANYHAVTALGTSGCLTGTCLSVAPSPDAVLNGEGKRVFILNTDTSMPLSIQQGGVYALSFEAQAANAGEAVQLVLRSPVDYANKTNVAGVALDTSWRTYSQLLTAQATLSDARADFEFQANGMVRIDNVRLVRVQTATGNAQPLGFANTTATSQQFACPVANATACTKYVDVRTGSPVSFPLTLSAKAFKVAVLQDPLWMDPDHDGVPGDGVAGGLDRCASTPDGAGVNEQGCAVGQTAAP